MKKLIAIVCIIALMSTVAVSALANGSIVALKAELSEDIEVEVVKDDGTTEKATVTVSEPETENYENKEVAKAVKAANSAVETISVAEIATALADESEENEVEETSNGEVKVKTDKGNTVDLSKYSFASTFADLAIDENGEKVFNEDGKVSVKATIKFDALEGLAKTEDKEISDEELDDLLSDYLIMVIDPTTGEMQFIELSAENFDKETGALTIDFPFLGSFTLIQKIEENA